jgi:hypothetical protein
MTKKVTSRRGKQIDHIAAKKMVGYNSKKTVVLLHVMPSRTSVNNDHIQEWTNQDEEKLLTDNTADDDHLEDGNKGAQKSLQNE